MTRQVMIFSGTLIMLAMLTLRLCAQETQGSVEAALLGVTETEEASQVKTLEMTWTDATRQREVPVKMYLPGGEAEGPWPVVVFSHGLGGSRQGYGYLGRHWAQQGYVSVHLQHQGSDDAIWRGKPIGQRMRLMRQAARDGQAALDRPRDVTFAIDMLEQLNAGDSQIAGKLDLDSIAVAGHSFGAWTALASAGRTLVGKWRGEMNLRDERIKAAIILSGQSQGDPQRDARSFATIKIPALHMTGTLDTSPINNTQPKDRRVPFDLAPSPEQGGGEQYLVIFQGGDHMVFSGNSRWARQGDPAKDPAFHRLICQTTTAFLNAYLQDDTNARDWMRGGACEQELGEYASFEMK